MLIRRILNPFLYCETVDSTGGAGGSPAPGQSVQSVEGQGTPTNDGSQFWGLFPDVPEEHRSLLEPHLRKIQSEVGRLQSGFAPFKDLDAAQVQGLIQFDQRFQQDPISVWMDIATMLQEKGVIHGDLDLETLLAVAKGEDIEEEVEEAPASLEGLDPSIAAVIQRLEARIAEFESRDQQRSVERQNAVQDRLLETQKGRMKEALLKAGYPEEILTDERLIASIIAHRGQISAAIKAMMDDRNAILKGFVKQREPNPLNVNGDGPSAPPQDKILPREANDPFARARGTAKARLVRANREAAQN